jgi:hypothetical protein
MRGIAVVILTVCVLLGIAANPAFGCSCVPATRELWESDQPLIFRARIIAAELTDQKRYGMPVVVARFKVEEKFRGDPGTIEVLQTNTGGSLGSCGIPLTVGDQFIVFADKDGWIGQCTGTRIFLYRQDERLLEKLRDMRSEK